MASRTAWVAHAPGCGRAQPSGRRRSGGSSRKPSGAGAYAAVLGWGWAGIYPPLPPRTGHRLEPSVWLHWGWSVPCAAHGTGSVGGVFTASSPHCGHSICSVAIFGYLLAAVVASLGGPDLVG